MQYVLIRFLVRSFKLSELLSSGRPSACNFHPFQDVDRNYVSSESYSDVTTALIGLLMSNQVHSDAVVTYAAMRKRNMRSWLIVVALVYLIVTASHLLIAVFGYCTFGSVIEDDILLNYSQKSITMTIGKRFAMLKRREN